jgi:hypothetical protein
MRLLSRDCDAEGAALSSTLAALRFAAGQIEPHSPVSLRVGHTQQQHATNKCSKLKITFVFGTLDRSLFLFCSLSLSLI